MKEQASISLTTGALEVPVLRDGIRVGALCLRPDDTAFLTHFYALLRTVEEQRTALAAQMKADVQPEAVVAALQEVCHCLRTEIDAVFGAGTSELIFGEGCGLQLLQQFFAGVAEVLRTARADKLAAYTQPDAGAVLE